MANKRDSPIISSSYHPIINKKALEKRAFLLNHLEVVIVVLILIVVIEINVIEIEVVVDFCIFLVRFIR